MRTTTPTENRLPAELPVVFYERRALRLHDRIMRRAVRHLVLRLIGKPEVFSFEEERVSRQAAMQPDWPRAEGLRALGLERFLNAGTL